MRKILCALLISASILLSACTLTPDTEEISFMKTVVKTAIARDTEHLADYYFNWNYLNSNADDAHVPLPEYENRKVAFVEYMTLTFAGHAFNDYAFTQEPGLNWVNVKLSYKKNYLTAFKVFKYDNLWYFSD